MKLRYPYEEESDSDALPLPADGQAVVIPRGNAVVQPTAAARHVSATPPASTPVPTGPMPIVSAPFEPTPAPPAGLPSVQQFFQAQPRPAYTQQPFNQPIYQETPPTQTEETGTPWAKLAMLLGGIIVVLAIMTIGTIRLLHGSNSSGTKSAVATPKALRALDTPCYSTKIDVAQKITSNGNNGSGNCHIATSDSSGADIYEISAYNVAGMNTANLASTAKSQAQQLLSQNQGSKISSQDLQTFVNSPAYEVRLDNGNSGTATILYVYHESPQGYNLFIIDQFNNSGSSDLGAVTSSWHWK